VIAFTLLSRSTSSKFLLQSCFSAYRLKWMILAIYPLRFVRIVDICQEYGYQPYLVLNVEK